MGGVVVLKTGVGTGTGAEVMQRVAVPRVGGLISSTILTLLVILAIYALAKGREVPTAER